MVNINLMEHWKIKSDKRQWMLVHEVNGQNRVEGHYSTLENCVQGFIDMKIRLSDATSVFLLIQYIKSLEITLNQVLSPLKLEVKPSSKIDEEYKTIGG